MPKDNTQHHNPPKPKFTSYKLAGTETECVTEMRECYALSRQFIADRRAIRLDNRFWDTRQKPHPIKIRAGYPTKRFVDPERMKKKGVAFVNHLYRFKLEEVGDRVRVWILHATRGWKLYA